MELHLAVEFGVAGVPVQHYRALACVAQIFASEALRRRLARRITIDDTVIEEMKELPYQRLYLD